MSRSGAKWCCTVVPGTTASTNSATPALSSGLPHPSTCNAGLVPGLGHPSRYPDSLAAMTPSRARRLSAPSVMESMAIRLGKSRW